MSSAERETEKERERERERVRERGNERGFSFPYREVGSHRRIPAALYPLSALGLELTWYNGTNVHLMS